MSDVKHIAITGAAGQIGYQLCFRIASGQLLGPKQRVRLQLIEIPPALDALKGVAMELDDCAFPLLDSVLCTTDADEGFKEADYAILVGARPRGPGMERSDLLQANASIFSAQGKALSDQAKPNCKVLVVGNPANTNALITQKHAKNLDPRNITAMTRLDHNRAVAQLANKAGCTVNDIEQLCIWGNHSSTQYPDIHHATIHGKTALDQIDDSWMRDTFIPTVQTRGGAIIAARGASSAASAASSAIDHIRDWALGSNGRWVSMGIPATGDYDMAGDVIYSYPVICADGEYSVVTDLDINAFSRERQLASLEELLAEREAIQDLL